MKYSHRLNIVCSILLGIIFSNIHSQVQFDQTQSIRYQTAGAGLTIHKTIDDGNFAEVTFQNDQNVFYSMGISGSSNTFFKGINSVPYIFNGTGNDFRFWSAGTEEFKFNISGLDISTIDLSGLKLNGGRALTMESPNSKSDMFMFVENGGHLVIQRDSTPGSTTAMYILNTPSRIAINSKFPETDLHVRQSTKPIFDGPNEFVQNMPGLTIQDSSTFNHATLFLDNSGHLSIAFNDIYRGWWNKTTGKYTEVSDLRLKKNIVSMPSVLPAIKMLRPVYYHFNNQEDWEDKTLGFIAQEVEKVLPELVSYQNKTKALSYGEFGIIAIKAIQEQQEMIDDLVRTNEILLSKLDALHDSIMTHNQK